MADDIGRRMEHAIEIARAAGDFALGHFRGDALDIERKGDGTPVTIADRGSERLMRERIASAFPADGILGEEEGEESGESGFTWILDPVDGTRSFVRGVPLWGVLVAVEHEGEPIVGVVNCPAAREFAWAGRGLGAFWSWDGGSARPAHVSTRPLASGLISMGSPRYLAHHTSPAALERVLFAAQSTRAWADCYQHLLVATGRIEAAIDAGTAVWDNAALMPLIEEAGGRFSSFTGERTVRGNAALSTNGVVHDELLALLAC